jgi:hypothetical protein
VRRQISPEVGHALEKLGHAIEYLEDMYIIDIAVGHQNDGTLQAIRILKALNREIYFECPTYMTIWERVQAFLERFEFPPQ